jgi:release factor glutamine methyltransferase
MIDNCLCCDSADALKAEFDLVVCNMPYLPSNEITDSTVDGLHEGILIPLKIIKSAKNVIKKGGRLLFLTSSLANYEELIKQAQSLGLRTKIIATRKMFFEELILVEATK